MCLVCDCVNVNDAVGTAVIKDRYLTFAHSLFKASTAGISLSRPAVSATKHDAALLEVDTVSPLLEIKRIALTLDGAAVELRISHCSTSNNYYHNTVF